MAVKPIPDGYHAVTPYLMVKNVPKLLEFVKAGLGAELIHKTCLPDGTVCHAQVRIGDSFVMMGEARPGTPTLPAMLYLYVADCDASYKRAVDAGAASIMPPTNMFYGDRNGGVKDASDNQWWFASRFEDVSAAELAKRSAAQRG